MLVALLACGAATAIAEEPGFETLFDGKSLAGWKVNENPASWKVVDGEIVCQGPRSHLFYVGPDAAKPAFALPAHDPGSEVHDKNIRVKRLP